LTFGWFFATIHLFAVKKISQRVAGKKIKQTTIE